MNLKMLIIALSATFLILGCEDKKEQSQNLDENKSEVVEQKTAPKDENITLNLMSGEKLNLSVKNASIKIQNNDKATLFVFFTTWCPPCRAEIPHLNNLSDKFTKDLNIVGILLEEKSNDEINEFINKFKIKYEISNSQSNYDLEKAIGGVIGLPFSILYKSDGSHAATYTGLVPEEMLESDILKAVK